MKISTTNFRNTKKMNNLKLTIYKKLLRFINSGHYRLLMSRWYTLESYYSCHATQNYFYSKFRKLYHLVTLIYYIILGRTTRWERAGQLDRPRISHASTIHLNEVTHIGGCEGKRYHSNTRSTSPVDCNLK